MVETDGQMAVAEIVGVGAVHAAHPVEVLAEAVAVVAEIKYFYFPK